MQITPRYDSPPILTIADEGDVGTACIRQRRRFQALAESLGDDEWQASSRCAAWNMRDVVAHVVDTNRFWSGSIAAGLAGTPTRMLAGFDPKRTPAAMVDAGRSAGPAEMLGELGATNDEICGMLTGLDEAQWSTIADAPPGHVPIRVLAHHALWDCWVHERDMALPLGRTVVEEPDEMMASLRYVSALSPTLAVAAGTATPATLLLETTEPDGRVVVEVTDHVAVHDRPPAAPTVVVRDTAAGLVEALSYRAPLATPVADEYRWLVETLGEVFESI